MSLDLSSFRVLADRLSCRYAIDFLCTDGNPVYGRISLAGRHVVGKAETCLVESMNAKIRRCLARFNRRTCRYSKAFDRVGSFAYAFI